MWDSRRTPRANQNSRPRGEQRQTFLGRYQAAVDWKRLNPLAAILEVYYQPYISTEIPSVPGGGKTIKLP